jgi:uncharacterized repeat protein (TIGR01451 family)
MAASKTGRGLTSRGQSAGLAVRGLSRVGPLLGILLAATSASAQSYAIPWWTVDGGGTMTASGGTYSLSGTAGQPDAGVLSGGAYSVAGGFWGGAGQGSGLFEADLAVGLSDSPDPVTGLGAVTYTIAVSNAAGFSQANNLSVTQSFTSIPGSVSFLSASGSGWNCPAGSTSVTCTRASLASGSSAPNLTVQWTVGPEGGTLTASATVTASEPDPFPSDNTATTSTTVTGVPYTDLSISKTDGQATTVTGQPITYAIVVSNAGPSTATGATVADTVPVAITGATWTCVGAGGGTCTASGSGSINDTVNLPAGGSVAYTLTGTISASAIGSLSNTATVAAPGGLADPNLANNSATDTDTLVGLDYFTLAPCRVVDTRDLGAPIGGPVLQGQQTRIFAVVGHCDIPSTAKALSINATATQASATGHVRLFPAGLVVPTVSSINYAAGQTRANNAIISLNPSGELAAFIGQPAGTTVHLIIDVNGYFDVIPVP